MASPHRLVAQNGRHHPMPDVLVSPVFRPIGCPTCRREKTTGAIERATARPLPTVGLVAWCRSTGRRLT
nr:MAG: hypothetical protein DIU78_05165 [Pseudomonadota bacterium]